MIIEGKYGQAVVYTSNIEETAIEQIKELMDLEAFEGTHVRIMPDVHPGVGCVIGFTSKLKGKIIPNIVGVDIGCGMLTTMLGKVEIDLALLDRFIHEAIPSGNDIHAQKQYDYIDQINSLRCIRSIRGDTKQWNRGIGSLGGGNHFIEINVDDDGFKYLVIHSGSRNLGNRVANHYQKLAVEYHSGLNDEYYAKRNEIITTFKNQGRKDAIESELALLKKAKTIVSTIPDELCYLEGPMMEDYLHDMAICQEYAKINREVIAKTILEHQFGHAEFPKFHTIHNYVDFEDSTIRKGAIKANLGELLLIPINMRDGSILAKGKGNPEWNNSAPHGAGRVLSRLRAKELISLEAYKQSMDGIYSTSVNESTVDESPMAYKSREEIIEHIQDSVDILKVLKSIYNFKAS